MKYTIELEYSGDPIIGWTATVHFPGGGAVTYGSVIPNELPHAVLEAAADHVAFDVKRSEEPS